MLMVTPTKRLFSAALPAVVILGLVAAPARAITGFLSTPPTSGVISGGNYAPAEDGYRIDYDITQNPNDTWHYEYDFSDAAGGELTPAVSHIILQLSSNIMPGDLFNFGGDAGATEFGTFGPSPSNPGFPAGETLFGIKIDTTGNQVHIQFDSNRQPMWGDFYSKGGSGSFAYNTSFGVAVADPNDFLNPPRDAAGAPLFKLLVPDTIVPEPAGLALAAIGALVAGRRRS